jgi:hypothetical protein
MGHGSPSSLLAQKLRQLGDVRRNPPRFVAGVVSPSRALSAPSWEGLSKTDFYVKN